MDLRSLVVRKLEEYLAVERELGVRAVEIDRSLLVANSAASSSAISAQEPSNPKDSTDPKDSKGLVFVAEKEPSAGAKEIIGKITGQLKIEQVVVWEKLVPAKAYIVLGSAAMRKFFDERTSPGHYLTKYPNAYVTYSPELFVQMGVNNPQVLERKREMWSGIKGVVKKYEIQ